MKTIGAISSSHYWTPYDFAAGSTLYAWYDASQTATITDAGSGRVSAIADLSGNARHLAQGTNDSRPTTGTRTLNGLNALDCDATSFNQHLLLTTGISLPQPFTLLMVCTQDAQTTIRGVHESRDSEMILLTDNADSYNWHLYGGSGMDADTNHTPATTTALNLVVCWNGLTSTLHENGTQYGGALDATSLAGNRIRWGGCNGARWDGLICELAVVSTTITTSFRTHWNEYCKGKWGTSG